MTNNKDANNSKILVTGGLGLIGSALVNRLVAKGYQIRVADDKSKHGSVMLIPDTVEFVKADLRIEKDAEMAMEGMDVCLNLAAKIGGIGYFHKHPAAILADNNAILTATFRAAVKHKLKRMIYVSSSMVYEGATEFPLKEEHMAKIPVPETAYGMSKLVGEWYCTAFWEEHGLPYSIVRPFNAYGEGEIPGDSVGDSHVIPDLIAKVKSGQTPLRILGDGKQTRCYTHVDDVSDGLIAIMESPEAENEAFNIASAEETTVMELAMSIWAHMRPEETFATAHDEAFKYDVRRRFPSVEKAKSLLGWQAKVKLKDGLPKVIDAIASRI